MSTWVYGAKSRRYINATNEAITNFRINGNNGFAVECVRCEGLLEDHQYARNNTPLEEDGFLTHHETWNIKHEMGFLIKHVYTGEGEGWYSIMKEYCLNSNMSPGQSPCQFVLFLCFPISSYLRLLLESKDNWCYCINYFHFIRYT